MFPELSRYIHDFLRPKIKTPLEWAEFYIVKTHPLRYEVGMDFLIKSKCHTIVDINNTYIITISNSCITYHRKNINYIEYKGFEMCESLPWTNVYGHFTKRFQFIFNFLRCKYMEQLEKNDCINYLHRIVYSQFLDDYSIGYANWGKIVNKIEMK